MEEEGCCVKIGNHLYKKKIIDGVAYLIQGCDGVTSKSNKMLHQCGQWTVKEIKAHKTPFNENIEAHYAEILAQVEGKCVCGISTKMPDCDGKHRTIK
jgi:hypothetical protein